MRTTQILLGMAAAAALAGAAHAQVVTQWTLTGEPGNQAFTAAGASAAGITGLPMTRGSGINATAAVDTLSGSGWNTLGADDYFSFGFSVEPGLEVHLSQLFIGTRSSNTGPGSLGLFHSGDGFNASIHTFVQNGQNVSNNVVDLSTLGPLSGVVEFRVMSLNGTSASGASVAASGTFRFSDYSGGSDSGPVRLIGQVAPSGGFAVPICTGDGAAAACPCGNFGVLGAGCSNSAGPGATLHASGTSSVSAADLVLSVTGLPAGAAGVLFQGTSRTNGAAGAPFGDGLRCAGGMVTRLAVLSAGASGQASSTDDLALIGSVAPGHVRIYQLWYPDAAGLCGTGFNLTQGLEITWTP